MGGFQGGEVSTRPFEAFPEPTEEIPTWSGKFIEYFPRTFGVLFIHADDTRTHPFPKGWHPISYEPSYLCDQEVWLLTTDQAEWDIDYIESLGADDPELAALLSDRAPVKLRDSA